MERNWQKLTDCRYYLQNSCRFTSQTCPYRHCSLLLNNTSRIVCQAWDKYECFDENCANYHPSGVNNHLQDLKRNSANIYVSKKNNSDSSRSSRNGGGIKMIGVDLSDDEMKFPNENIRSQSVPSSSTSTSSSSSQQSYCIYYMRGKCLKGNQCPYLHEKQGDDIGREGTQRSTENKRKAEDILLKHSFKKSIQHLVKEDVRETPSPSINSQNPDQNQDNDKGEESLEDQKGHSIPQNNPSSS